MCSAFMKLTIAVLAVLLGHAHAQTPPADEEIEVTLTHPMPIEGGPADCQVDLSERYCRADKLPVSRFTVLHQRVSGNLSSVGGLKLVRGCVVTEVKLGTNKAAKAANQCVPGDPEVRFRIVLSAAPK